MRNTIRKKKTPSPRGKNTNLIRLLAPVLIAMTLAACTPESTDKVEPYSGQRRGPRQNTLEPEAKQETAPTETVSKNEEAPPPVQQRKTTANDLAMVFKPKKPTPADKIHVLIYGYGDQQPKLVWFRNNREIMRGTKTVLDGGGLRKGDTLKVEAIVGQAIKEISVIIGNQPPIFTSAPLLKKQDGKYVAEMKGLDPDGDKIHLTLPAPVKGVTTDGMKLIVDPEAFGSKERTIPIALTDGEKFAGYLYRIKIETVRKKAPKK